MDFIKFLGTAGARFAVTRQIRKSGGIWISLDNTQILIDPGPGSLVRCLSSKPPLDPQDLDGIILTHRHIDHSNDINIMIEAMTNGGYNKKGMVFAPSDALDDDPVVLHHFRGHVNQIIPLTEKGSYQIGSLSFSTPIRHIHDVETYGLVLHGSSCILSYVSDTKYFENLETYYPSDVMIVNVVLRNAKEYINHLSIDDVEKIVTEIRPKKTILTHFGLTMIKEKPWELAEMLTKKTGYDVIAASDGLQIPLDQQLCKTHK
jgi:ribonuclease BN (tRNA processing enzyme)